MTTFDYPEFSDAESVRRSRPQRTPNKPFACAALAIWQTLRHSRLKHYLLQALDEAFPRGKRNGRQQQFAALLTEDFVEAPAQELKNLGIDLANNSIESRQGWHDPHEYLMSWLKLVYGEAAFAKIEPLISAERTVLLDTCPVCKSEGRGTYRPDGSVIDRNPLSSSDDRQRGSGRPLGLESFLKPHILDTGDFNCVKCEAAGTRTELSVQEHPVLFTSAQQSLIVQLHHHNDARKIGEYEPRNISLVPYICVSSGDLLDPSTLDGCSYFALASVIQYKGDGTVQSGHYRSLIRDAGGVWWIVDDNQVVKADNQTEPWLDYGKIWVVRLAFYDKEPTEEAFRAKVGALYFDPANRLLPSPATTGESTSAPAPTTAASK